MTLGAPWGHDGKTYSGKEMRQLVDSMFATTGVVGVNEFLVEQQTSPGPTVKVAAGELVIAATGAGLYGKYQVPNDASINSPSFTPTGANGRKDRLIMRVTAGVAALEIVEGVASGSPAEPAITGDNYEELALVTWPVSTTNVTTAMITDRRRRAASTGGVVVCASSATYPASPTEGLVVYDKALDAVLVYLGAAWAQIGPLGAWTSFVPSLVYWGLGNSTYTAVWMRVGRMITFHVRIVIGSTATIGAGLGMYLPVPAVSGPSVDAGCHWYAQNVGTAQVEGIVGDSDPAYVNLYANNVAGTYPAATAVSTTIPFTWATGDYFVIGGTYEAAA